MTESDSKVLEGIYNGVTGKIDEAKNSVVKEMQRNAAQQNSTYDSLAKSVKDGKDSVIREIQYLMKQTSDASDESKDNGAELKQLVVSAVSQLGNYLEQKLTERLVTLKRELIDAMPKFDVTALETRLSKRLELQAEKAIEAVEDVEDRLAESAEGYERTMNAKLDAMKEELLGAVNEGGVKLAQLGEDLAALREELNAPAEEVVEEEVFDYDLLAEKIAALMPETDYDLVADKLLQQLPPVDADAIADKVVETLPAFDYEKVTECVETALEQDFDLTVDEQGVEAIASRVAELLMADAEEEVEELEEVEEEDTFDYDGLAEKVAALVEEKRLLSEEEAAIKAAEEAAAHPVEEEENCCEELAEKIATLVVEKCRAAEEAEPVEEVVEEVVEEIVEIDYDQIAEKVVALLEEKGLTAAAPAEEEAPAQEVVEEEVVEEPAPVEEEAVEEPAPIEEEVVEEPAPVEEEAVEEPAPIEEEVVEEPAPIEEEAVEEPAPVEEELAVATAPVEEEAVAEPVDASNEKELVTRYKKSFTAKIIDSEEIIKEHYSVLKNKILSYSKITNQLNWSNDRFAYNNDTIAKVAVRGKTLCVYLALNPEEFPESVYHQKFAGDTKMYEKTPLMMKVKSNVAVKRTIRLIELLMERLGTVEEEGFESVDYAAQYVYRSEEQLIAEGLIKVAVVEKTDLDF